MAVSYIDGAVMNEAAPSTTGTITIPATVQRGDDLYVSITSSGHTAGTALCAVTDDDTAGRLNLRLLRVPAGGKTIVITRSGGAIGTRTSAEGRGVYVRKVR